MQRYINVDMQKIRIDLNMFLSVKIFLSTITILVIVNLVAVFIGHKSEDEKIQRITNIVTKIIFVLIMIVTGVFYLRIR